MSVNKVFLIGNLGSDVKVRHLPDGRPVANVNMATNEVWRDSDGNKQTHTEWHRLNFFGRQAEVASEYLGKGSQIFVEGMLRTRKWQDNEGNERQFTEVRVGNFQMLDRRGERRSDEGGGSYESESRGSGSGAGQRQEKGGGGLDDLDEDIPW